MVSDTHKPNVSLFLENETQYIHCSVYASATVHYHIGLGVGQIYTCWKSCVFHKALCAFQKTYMYRAGAVAECTTSEITCIYLCILVAHLTYKECTHVKCGIQ